MASLLLVHGLILVWTLKGVYGQSSPVLTLTSISGGCLINGQSRVVAEGTADFTNGATISEWDNLVYFVATGVTLCTIPVDTCSKSVEACQCQKEVNEEYALVMNQTADKSLSGRPFNLYIVRYLPSFAENTSNVLQYPEIYDPVEETLLYNNSTDNKISDEILPDDVTSVIYTITGLVEPYSIKYSVSEPPMYTKISNTTDVNITTNQRMLYLAYEELGPTTCQRQGAHTLCRKGGIEETVKFDNVVATDNTLPINIANLDYTLSMIIEPYMVVVTITYDASPKATHTFPNTSDIQVAVNGSKQICISYQETGTGRLPECLGQAERCFATAPQCSCDCDDWKESYTVIPFLAMVVKVICAGLVLLLYCKRETFPDWPAIAAVLYVIMLVTAVCNVGIMCYQEIDDCGLCDCQYAFILVEMIVTVAAISSIMFLLYKAGGERFRQKWFRALLLVLAVAMAVISIIGIIAVFCNKEISGSGVDSWHIIYLIVGIAMAAVVVIGIIALFACQGSPVKDSFNSRNGKESEKLPSNEVELDYKDGPNGRSNPAYARTNSTPADEKQHNHPYGGHGDDYPNQS